MADVRYNFVSTGADAVAHQFLTIADAAKQSRKAVEDSSKAVDKAARTPAGGAGAGGGGGSARRPAQTPSEKLGLRVAAAQERADARTAKSRERFNEAAAKASERAAKRTADTAAREAKRTADVEAREGKRAAAEKVKATDYVAKIHDRHLVTQQQSGERAAKRTADAQARESKRSAAEQAKSAAYVAKIRDRHFATEQKGQERIASLAARANQAKQTKGFNEGKAFDEAFEKHKTNKRAERWQKAGDIGGAILGTAAHLTSGAALASLGLVGSAAREGIQLQDTANRISIGARGAGQAAVDPATLVRDFHNAARQAPGVKAEDIAEGAASFVAKTGDLAAARRFSGTFATAASATGSSVQDIAGAAADIFQKFDVTGVDDMREALAALTFQGKNGAFELKDAASQFAKMSAAASRFGLDKGSTGLRTLGGLTQIARSATGSSEQASTAVEAVFRQLVLKSGKLKAQGVDVFQKGSNSKTRNIQDILVDTIAKNKGSTKKLQDIFGDEGIRGVSPLISTFNEAKNGATGTEAEKTAAGVAALREALRNAIDAPGDWSEVVKDAAQAQTSSSAQLDAAWEGLKAKVADGAVPALTTLIPKMANLASAVDPAIKAFVGLVGGIDSLVSLLKDKGILDDHEALKELSPKEELAKVTKDLTDQSNVIGPMTPEQIEKSAKDRQRQITLQAQLGVTDQLSSSDDTRPFAQLVEGYAKDNMPGIVEDEGAARMWAKQQAEMVKGGESKADVYAMNYDIAPGAPEVAPKDPMSVGGAIGTLSTVANGGGVEVGQFKEAASLLLNAAKSLAGINAPSIVAGG